MAKLLLVYVLVILISFALTCTATLYTVGDNSGWDISTDLDTWAKDKRFVVGDVLLFQYSSSHSVNEVTRESFDGCNTTIAQQTNSNGNTSIPLATPGERYFVCGNKLHCLGGMKLQVNVENGQAYSPAAAPQAAGPVPGASGSLPRPSAKNNNPSATIPTSIGFIHGGRVSLVIAFLSFITTLL